MLAFVGASACMLPLLARRFNIVYIYIYMFFFFFFNVPDLSAL